MAPFEQLQIIDWFVARAFWIITCVWYMLLLHRLCLLSLWQIALGNSNFQPIFKPMQWTCACTRHYCWTWFQNCPAHMSLNAAVSQHSSDEYFSWMMSSACTCWEHQCISSLIELAWPKWIDSFPNPPSDSIQFIWVRLVQFGFRYIIESGWDKGVEC